MINCLIILLFRIVPSQQLINIKDSGQLDCQNYENQDYFFENSFNLISFCHPEYDIKIKNSNFKNFKMTKSGDSHFIKVTSKNVEIISSSFLNIAVYGALISCNENGISTLARTRVSECYNQQGLIRILYSDYSHNNFSYNTILFCNEQAKKGIALDLKYSTGNTIVGNDITGSFSNFSPSPNGCIQMKDAFVKDGPLEFSDCVFTSCRGFSPSILYINKLSSHLTIRNLTIKDTEGGDMIMITPSTGYQTPHLTFLDCKFKNLESDSFFGGIGLVFLVNYQNSLDFVNTSFDHVTHTQGKYGGGAIIVTSETIDEHSINCNLVVDGCRFNEVTSQGQGGAVYFDSSTKTVEIARCTFSKVSSSKDGHALFITGSTLSNAEIVGCTFTDCGTGADKHAIIVRSKELHFLYNAVAFTSLSGSCQCVETGTEATSHYFVGNTFRNVQGNNNQLHRSPVIHEVFGGTASGISIVIEDNTFDCISGDMQGRCIFVSFYNRNTVTIRNNTIMNLPAGGIYIKVIFTCNIDTDTWSRNRNFTIDSCQFIHNQVSTKWQDELGYCPQIFIQNEPTKYYNDPFFLHFVGCRFVENASPGAGGGLNIGRSKYTCNVQLHFVDCEFSGNRAGSSGGALCAETLRGCIIENCSFTKNLCENGGGGAIFFRTYFKGHKSEYYTPGSPVIRIYNSVFASNGNSKDTGTITMVTRDSGGPADHARPPLEIIGCSFTDNKMKEDGFVLPLTDQLASATIRGCKFEFTEESRGGINHTTTSSNKLVIDAVQFIGTANSPALRIRDYSHSDPLSITNCVFDSCSANAKEIDAYACFYISITASNPSLVFENNVFRNVAALHDSGRHYIASLIASKMSELVFRNITFMGNRCNSLYGGGTGLHLPRIEKISFIGCTFDGNTAVQTRKASRENQVGDTYFNGDGGGIQIGFYCGMQDVDVVFDGCSFTGNRAERHGGAIALQTAKTVDIKKCSFINNVANADTSQRSSLRLLFENHFSKKSEGRGGATYINPAYTSMDLCAGKAVSMESISIAECEFRSNTGFDGYAMYVEGDESTKTAFVTTGNTFVDNYNMSNYDSKYKFVRGGVISTEIHHPFPFEKTVTENSFSNTDGSLRVAEILYVDHYGRTTREFTDSSNFTSSRAFTSTGAFSQTAGFTETNDFTKSSAFEDSDEFTKSSFFSQTGGFSDSDAFSSSGGFSSTIFFTESGEFSNSLKFRSSFYFSSSAQFSSSFYFSSSLKFSGTFFFSSSVQFSESQIFSPSNDYLDSTGNEIESSSESSYDEDSSIADSSETDSSDFETESSSDSSYDEDSSVSDSSEADSSEEDSSETDSSEADSSEADSSETDSSETDSSDYETESSSDSSYDEDSSISDSSETDSSDYDTESSSDSNTEFSSSSGEEVTIEALSSSQNEDETDLSLMSSSDKDGDDINSNDLSDIASSIPLITKEPSFISFEIIAPETTDHTSMKTNDTFSFAKKKSVTPIIVGIVIGIIAVIILILIIVFYILYKKRDQSEESEIEERTVIADETSTKTVVVDFENALFNNEAMIDPFATNLNEDEYDI